MLNDIFLFQKQIFFIIYGLCINSKTQVLARSEIPVLTLVLKTAKDPPAFTIRSNDFQGVFIINTVNSV